jgi:nicotinic acid mononucleotide adenylyltransferase
MSNTLYEDPVLLENVVTFYGPKLDDQSRKVGIYGGAFDPPHNSHKLRVEQLYDANSLNKVVITVAANTPRKPNLSPQKDRYKWTVMMIEEILNEKNDQLITDFKLNPEKNNSKFDVTMEELSTADTIVRVRSEYPGNDVIFIYGSDYDLKSGNTTPLDSWNPPQNYSGKTNFYHDVTQIQFKRPAGDTSSTAIRNGITEFMSENNISNINSLAEEDITEEPLSSNLQTLAVKLNMSRRVLLSYIRFKMNSQKGGFNVKDKYYEKYIKYKTKYLELRKLL